MNDEGVANGNSTENDCDATPSVGKRLDYISWEDYFMSVAILSAQRSKDPATQVGACIVNEDRKIVGIGYNGMPLGCSDDELPWKSKSQDQFDNKSFYVFFAVEVCHAEMNAIMNSISRDLKRCCIFTTRFPCNECAKLIIQSGIKRVIFCHDKLNDPKYDASKRMFDMAGINYTKFQPVVRRISIDFTLDDVKCDVDVTHEK